MVMVNFEKLAALTAALYAGNTDQARAIARDEGPLAKRDTNISGWIESEGTAVPRPRDDEFYTFLTPDDVGSYKLGDIIKYRQVGIYNSSLTAWQLVYRSENSSGHAIGALTTIVTPENNDGEHVIVYPQPQDASYINCATSYELVTRGFDATMEAMLAKGWVLNMPDHEGFNSSFTAGVLEGKITLDSIRAFESSRDITGLENDIYAVSGYSGGSIAAGWAAELQESYAPDLNIVAYTMGGFVNNLTAVIETVNETPYVGFVFSGLVGLAGEYPDLWALYDEDVKNGNLTSITSAMNMCVLDALVAYSGQNFFDYFTDGDSILSESLIAEVVSNNTLKKTTPKVPMFIFNGVVDQIVPVSSVDAVVEYYCSNDANLVYTRGAGLDHTGMLPYCLVDVIVFIENAFNGDVPSGCSFDGATPEFASKYNGSYDGFSSSTTYSNSSSNSTTASKSSSSGSASGSSTGSSSTSSSSSTSTGNAAAFIQPAGALVITGLMFLL